jgi:oxygen-independent coproporphyrinogen-3 oxidase
VRYVSVGVEALQDRHLRTLQRPYTVAEAKAAVRRAVARGFDCVNADTIFALPGQTLDEVEEAGRALVDLGVDQVAAYPLFQFPYTGWPRLAKEKGYRRAGLIARRRMLRVLEQVFVDAGFERSSVWAFTRRSVEKYCSVTVPLYVGLGASGGTYLRDVFYLNTFRAAEYVRALEDGRLPIALVLDLPERARMGKWLYWRIYETRFATEEFRERFGRDFDQVFGRYMNLLALGGFLHRQNGEIVLTSRGAYWLHVLEDLFSIDHVETLWGAATKDPWPQKVVL